MMSLESWKTSWRRNVSIAMMAMTVLMFGDVAYQTWMHFRWQTWVGKYAAAASPTTQPATQPATQPTTQPAASQPTTQPAIAPAGRDKPRADKPDKPDKPAKPLEVNAAIRKRNIFAPPTPPGQPPPLIGIMGNIALFLVGNETVGIEEGKSDRGVTVKSIKGYEVAIEFGGKPQTVKFVAGSGPSAPSAPSGPGGPGEGRPMPPPGGAPPPGQAVHGMPPGAAIGGRELPEEVRKQLEAQGTMKR